VIPTRSGGIVDIESISADYEAETPQRSVKPHLLKTVENRTEESLEENGIPSHNSLREMKTRPKMSDSPIQPLTDSEVQKSDKLEDRLKLKKFRWMPNPFLANSDLRQGGPLYYAKYFQDRKRALDEKSVREELSNYQNSEEPSDQSTRGRRPKAVWKTYRPLTIPEIVQISSLQKFSRILANEVHLVTKNGLTDIANKEHYDNKFRNLLMDSPEDILALVKCMHYYGVLKSSPPMLEIIIEKISDSRNILKPINYIYTIQAMSRMNYRDHRLIKILDNLALCWGTVAIKNPLMLIRGANAISRLDLVSSSPYMTGLKDALAECLPRLTPSQLERIKGITVIELFDHLMILDFFVLCFEKKIHYSRNLILVYLKYRNVDEVMNKVPSHVRDWLAEIVKQDTQLRLAMSNENSSFSSKLHSDIARVLSTTTPHNVLTSQRCGPFVFDIFIPSSNTVIEACSEFQFYNRTSKLTAEAKLRHELIRGLGFQLVPVFHFNWAKLSTDSAKAKWLDSNS